MFRESTQSHSDVLPLARLRNRIFAGMIDQVIVGLLSILLSLVVGMLARSIILPVPGLFFPLPGAGGLMGVPFLVLWLAYFTLFEGTSGQTPGKRVAKIRVVREDGSEVSFASALIRSALRIVDFLPFTYVIGIILIATTDSKQRLGDLLAKTIVVKASKN